MANGAAYDAYCAGNKPALANANVAKRTVINLNAILKIGFINFSVVFNFFVNSPLDLCFSLNGANKTDALLSHCSSYLYEIRAWEIMRIHQESHESHNSLSIRGNRREKYHLDTQLNCWSLAFWQNANFFGSDLTFQILSVQLWCK